MAVVARSWQEDDRLSKNGIVATSCRISASSAISGLRLGMVRTAVGDRYVLEHMREHGYNLGGEQSATSSCRITPRPATGWWRRSSFSPWCSASSAR